MKIRTLVLLLLVAGCATVSTQQREAATFPVISFHQHLASPAAGVFMGQPGAFFDADTLVAQLDDAGIHRAVVLSVAYFFGDDRRHPVDDEEAKVRAENDWTAAQVATWPDRLVGFCSVNPLRPYAMREFARCARLPRMIGLKLHFGNSGVSLRDPEHLARIQEIVRAADSQGLPIVVHLRAREGTPFGRADAEIFLRDVLSEAPNSVVQIAHLAGAGGFPDYADEVMGVFCDAIAVSDPRMRQLYFDVTSVATEETTAENGRLIAERLRQTGMRRVLFGADLPFGGNPAPREAWAVFREKVPLTEAEFRDIADNVTPYMR